MKLRVKLRVRLLRESMYIGKIRRSGTDPEKLQHLKVEEKRRRLPKKSEKEWPEREENKCR